MVPGVPFVSRSRRRCGLAGVCPTRKAAHSGERRMSALRWDRFSVALSISNHHYTDPASRRHQLVDRRCGWKPENKRVMTPSPFCFHYFVLIKRCAP